MPSEVKLGTRPASEGLNGTQLKVDNSNGNYASTCILGPGVGSHTRSRKMEKEEGERKKKWARASLLTNRHNSSVRKKKEKKENHKKAHT